MKKEELKEFLRKKSVKAGSIALAAMIAVGSLWASKEQGTVIPEMVTYVDMEDQVVVEGEEVPLAAPKVTQSTKTTKKTKKIKMKKASAKTYTKQGKTTKKTKTKKSNTKKESTTTKTETTTSVTNQYKKGSKVNTQVTTTKTVVTKTIVSKQVASAAKKETIKADTKVTASNNTATYANGPVSLKTIAPKLDGRVISAYETLHFTVNVNSGVSYSGKFSTREQGITLKKVNDTIYHEIGHFVGFIAGNVDLSPQFQEVYNKEKSLYKEGNKSYVLSSTAEYFAESFKEYTLTPAKLKAERPVTYAAMEDALNKITGAQVSAVWNIYKSVWK